MVHTAPVATQVTPGPLAFDAEKAVEAILYVAPRVGNDLYRSLKAIYFADRCHLFRYGRFIYGDEHSKLPFGPAPQGAYDILKHVGGRQSFPHFEEAKAALQLQANNVRVLRDPHFDFFSDSEIECLDEGIATVAGKHFEDIKVSSHGRAYEITTMGHTISAKAMATESDDAAALVQFLEDSAP